MIAAAARRQNKSSASSIKKYPSLVISSAIIMRMHCNSLRGIAAPQQIVVYNQGELPMPFFSHKKQLENDLLSGEIKALQEKLGSINLSCATIWFTPDGMITDASDMFLSVIGYSLNEIKGQHHRVLCPKEVLNSIEYRSFWQDLSNGKAKRGKFLRSHKDGSDVWLEATYIPILENGAVSSIIKIANDITGSYQQSIDNEFLIAAIQRSNAVIEFTPDGTVITANQNFLTAMGFRDIKEIAGQHHKIFCTQDFYNENPHFWQKLSSGNIEQGLFQRISKSGNTVWLEATYNPVFDHRGKVIKVTKIANDVTTRIEKQLAIQKAAEVAYSTSVETAQVSERGAQILKENLNNSEKISSDIKRSSKLIEDLNQQSGEISKIVTTIKSIADQTNLLALNAAIEAARAGEHGRGFAVVADEVRTLAASTSKSTEEINHMVERNNRMVIQTRDSMIEVTQQAGKNADLINEATRIIDEILKGAEHVSQVVVNLVDSSNH
ncbi:methyl-accepting chemotaxis protein [Cellvibrio mixtus]|nr:PAS domain-containing methyl-accepting chemotaxis protein [Cellvibrio mixtus]